ncbi:MAG: YIP1 family protein [Anaerolineales bacterium]|nr:YIP1 family protein [Anaerolineales bacterium]
MPVDLLQQAITLIRQGHKGEAQPLLQTVIRSNPRDVAAWMWYVETQGTPQERLQVLRQCLKLNPADSRVARAIQVISAKLPPVPPPAEPKPHSVSPFSTDPAPAQADELRIPDSWMQDGGDAFLQGQYQPEPVPVMPEKPKPANEWVYTPSPPDPEEERQARPLAHHYPWFEVWLNALTSRSVEDFEDLLRDPQARAGRAYEWIVITGLISGVVGAVSYYLVFDQTMNEFMNTPEFAPMAAEIPEINTAMVAVILFACMIPLSGVSSLINIMITGGIQHLVAKMFGGLGTFDRTIYALGAFVAPLSIGYSLLGIGTIAIRMDPYNPLAVMLNCVTSIVSLAAAVYYIMLNVRALRAAHNVNSLQAIGAMVLPWLFLFFLFCLLGVIFGASVGDVLNQIDPSTFDAYQF